MLLYQGAKKEQTRLAWVGTCATCKRTRPVDEMNFDLVFNQHYCDGPCYEQALPKAE